MIKCVIIDDEKLARDALELMLVRFFNEKVKVVAKAESVKEGVFAIYKTKPDLVFLDIEMPDENGFQIFNYFQKVNFSIVFTTAYQEYAIKAIKLAALDYILKPLGIEELRGAIELYEKKQSAVITIENIDKLVNALNPAIPLVEKVALPTFNGYQLEKVNSIMYCEADQSYTKIFTVDGKNLLISKPISFIEQLLPLKLFFRIHKSYIVNLNYVKTYSRDEGFRITLENGKKLDIATRRNEEFLKALTIR